jgi:hypothetical protein
MLTRNLVLTIASLLVFSTVSAQEPVSKSMLGGVAIDGHDTVAYHDPESIARHEAQKGNKQYTAEWKGATWRFARESSRDAFVLNPGEYSPAYNGHCANALSLGEGLLKTDGTHWEIFGDQLFLFYKARGRKRWNDGNFETYKAQADLAWQEILDNL